MPSYARGGPLRSDIGRFGAFVQFDDETPRALVLARDRMMDLQKFADEAFGDLLKKHGRSTDLRTGLRESVKKEESERR